MAQITELTVMALPGQVRSFSDKTTAVVAAAPTARRVGRGPGLPQPVTIDIQSEVAAHWMQWRCPLLQPVFIGDEDLEALVEYTPEVVANALALTHTVDIVAPALVRGVSTYAGVCVKPIDVEAVPRYTAAMGLVVAVDVFGAFVQKDTLEALAVQVVTLAGELLERDRHIGVLEEQLDVLEERIAVVARQVDVYDEERLLGL